LGLAIFAGKEDHLENCLEEAFFITPPSAGNHAPVVVAAPHPLAEPDLSRIRSIIPGFQFSRKAGSSSFSELKLFNVHQKLPKR
jgi:hypothetical protein